MGQPRWEPQREGERSGRGLCEFEIRTLAWFERARIGKATASAGRQLAAGSAPVADGPFGRESHVCGRFRPSVGDPNCRRCLPAPSVCRRTVGTGGWTDVSAALSLRLPRAAAPEFAPRRLTRRRVCPLARMSHSDAWPPICLSHRIREADHLSGKVHHFPCHPMSVTRTESLSRIDKTP